MTHDALSLDDIATLLSDPSVRPKPKQVGQLRYSREYKNCTTCGVICSVTIGDIPYCTTHALYALNEIYLEESIINDCTCEAGKKTMHSLHTSDCAIYDDLDDR